MIRWLWVCAMSSTDFEAAIQFAIDAGKIQSKAEIDTTKCTIGIDAFILRDSQGSTIASISKRVLKERAENDAVAKLKAEHNQTNND